MRVVLRRSVFRFSVLLALVLLTWQARCFAQDTVVPAGTLLHCVLDEPNFSSATAEVGDPVLCHLDGLQEFGRTAFPRGSYLEGHLEADKEPGHFVGKGYMRLVFDRIGLPNADVPLPSKVIAARGYRVDRQGDIVGHGHATRDAVEWLLPPLWPWKVITLPAKGPRPVIKGEEQVTLRLMEDIAVPRLTLGPGWHFFGESSGRSSQDLPQTTPPNAVPPSIEPARFQPVSSPAAPANLGQRHLTWIALKTGGVYAASSYRVDNGRMNFTLDTGETGSVSVAEVDWTKTSRLNATQSTGAPLEAGLRTF
jgi:hypothetical protein